MLKNSRPLAWGSSDVDWCEGNFVITVFIAEFYNTISNVLFFVFPPVLLYLFQQYAQRVTPGVNLVWVLLLVVGIGSVYFHATLSLFGQLLDEIAIIWMFMAAISIWYPRRYMPTIFHKDRVAFKFVILLLTLASSALALVMPAINCIVMFIMGVPATVLMIIELKRCESTRVYHLGLRCFAMWVIALASWISDKFFCYLWEAIHFPYMHCAWHIFIALAAYQACVLFAYFEAITELPEQKPVLKYWPYDNWGAGGIPYVVFKYTVCKPEYIDF